MTHISYLDLIILKSLILCTLASWCINYYLIQMKASLMRLRDSLIHGFQSSVLGRFVKKFGVLTDLNVSPKTHVRDALPLPPDKLRMLYGLEAFGENRRFNDPRVNFRTQCLSIQTGRTDLLLLLYTAH